MISIMRRYPLLPMLLGSVLTALMLIFPVLGILEWITMIPMLIGVYLFCKNENHSLKRAYGYGFLTVYIYYFIIYHWFVNLYPLDFVGMDEASSAVVVVAGWFGLPILQAVVGGGMLLAMHALSKNGFFERFPLMRPFVFASLWVIFEWCSTLTWAGVPWGRLVLGQIEFLPMVQSASLLGSYFVTWLLVAVNGLLAYALLYRPKAIVCAIVAGSLFCSNFLYGLIAQTVSYKKEENKITAAVIQGNIDSREKWGVDSYRITEEVYGRLTRRAAQEGAELVVWPETAFPSYINYNVDLQAFVSSLARECNITLVVGAMYAAKDGSTYNALFLVDSDGTIHEEYYAKRHLVPFGEYVPMRDVIMALIPPLAEVSALDGDISPGLDSSLLDSQWGKLGSLICFDSIYETLAIDSVRDGAGLMLISSNDNWFYDSAAVYQHQAQAQLRAIETGRYYVRAASSGISTVIAPDGELLAYIDPLTEGYEIADVYTREGNTLYTLIGNLFVYLCIAFCSFLLFVERFLRNLPNCARKNIITNNRS